MFPEYMVVSILPLDIKEGEPELNLKSVLSYADKLRTDTSILVLPELFSTGFLKDESSFQLLAEPLNGKTIKTLKEVSLKKGIAISGSFVCRDEHEGSLRNRAFFINPDNDGEVSYYDKRHLFSISPESRLLSAGKKPTPIIDFRGWKIGLSVCYDIRFPVWNRNVDNHYDMMIVPANWPDSRAYMWKHLIIGRAIENQAVYIAANRSGIDKFGTYSYLTSFGVDAKGAVFEETHRNSIIHTASFSLKELLEFREHFPVYKDADRFEIGE